MTQYVFRQYASVGMFVVVIFGFFVVGTFAFAEESAEVATAETPPSVVETPPSPPADSTGSPQANSGETFSEEAALQPSEETALQSESEGASEETMETEELESAEESSIEESQEEEGEVVTLGDGAVEEEVIDTVGTTSPESFISSSTSTPSATIEIEGTEGEATTTAGLASETEGDSEGGGTPPDGTPVINSGSAIVLANILNIINTNLVNSDGNIFFSNLLGAFGGTIDFRNVGSSSTVASCALLSCASGEGITVNLLNDAVIENFIRLQASTGRNAIAGADQAAIETGDAVAGLNLVNLANTNFVDSQYLLVTLNSFGGIHGDIVFPSIANWFGASGTTSVGSLAITNSGDIQNVISVEAGSGDNVVEASTPSTIATGSAASSSNIFNLLNTTLAGSHELSILLRVHGDWTGEVFGAPDWLTMASGGDGGFYFSASTPAGIGGATGAVSATNTAFVHNDIGIGAFTGGNSITDANHALISTGNARAAANVVNIANTNVIGRNWILAIINIFGDFRGNVAFGRPDLWVGAQAHAPNGMKTGDLVDYTFTIVNRGDSVASQAILTNEFGSGSLSIVDASLPYTIDSAGHAVFSLGTLLPGAGKEITYQARIDELSEGRMIKNEVRARERETDNNMRDNGDSVTIQTEVTRAYSGSGYSYAFDAESRGQVLGAATTSLPSNLVITRKTASTTIASFNQTEAQELIVSNPTSLPIPNVLLTDVLRDPSNSVIRHEQWELGTVLPKEEITIRYSILFGPQATSGVYTLSTIVRGGDALDIAFLNNGSILMTAAHEVAMPPPDMANPPLVEQEPVSIARKQAAAQTAEYPSDDDVVAPILAIATPVMPSGGAGDGDEGVSFFGRFLVSRAYMNALLIASLVALFLMLVFIRHRLSAEKV